MVDKLAMRKCAGSIELGWTLGRIGSSLAHLSDRRSPLCVICAANPVVDYRWDDQDRRGGGSRKLPREPSVRDGQRRGVVDPMMIIWAPSSSAISASRCAASPAATRISTDPASVSKTRRPRASSAAADDCGRCRCHRLEINHMGDDKTQSQTRGKDCCDAQRLSGAVAGIHAAQNRTHTPSYSFRSSLTGRVADMRGRANTVRTAGWSDPIPITAQRPHKKFGTCAALLDR